MVAAYTSGGHNKKNKYLFQEVKFQVHVSF